MYFKRIDNLLPKNYADIIEKFIDGDDNGSSIPWMWRNNLNATLHGKESVGNFYLNHTLIWDGEPVNNYSKKVMGVFLPILHYAGISKERLVVMKLNLYPRTQFRFHQKSHYDYPEGSNRRTLLYYVNDNNAFTVFDGIRKVKSKKNTLIMFDGSKWHHSTTCTNVNAKFTINMEIEIS